METQQRFEKIFSSKRKRLYAISLMIFSILGAIFAQLFFVGRAEAAIADIEILANVNTDNSSQTTSDNRWPTTSTREVTFQIRGGGLGNISTLLTGPKTAVLVIPANLAGEVSPLGNAVIETNLTVDLRNISLLTNLFSAIDNLLKVLVDIVNGVFGTLVGVNLNLDEVYQQLGLLDSLESLPNQSFTEPLTLSQNNQVMSVNLDNGIGKILADNLKGILQNLSSAVGALSAEGSGLVSNTVALLINTALAPVKLALTGAIAAVLPLLELGGSLVGVLADASLLGDTTVTMSTEIAALPNAAVDLDAEFFGTVVKSQVLDIDILKNSSGISSIYYLGERFELAQELLPTRFDFGSHPIQTIADETFHITEGLGAFQVEDTRTITKDWSMKVSQINNWSDTSENQLRNTRMTLYGGPVITDFSDGNIIHHFENGLTIQPNEQQTLFSVKEINSIGTVTIPLVRAELFIPKNTPRNATSYETTLVWTLSETPTS
ncbi:adhesive domain-containing protein [Enterococcus sp. LJL120]